MILNKNPPCPSVSKYFVYILLHAIVYHTPHLCSYIYLYLFYIIIVFAFIWL